MEQKRRFMISLARFFNLLALAWIAYVLFKDGFPPQNPFQLTTLVASAEVALYASLFTMLITFHHSFVGGFLSLACLVIAFGCLYMSKAYLDVPIAVCMLPSLMHLFIPEKVEKVGQSHKHMG